MKAIELMHTVPITINCRLLWIRGARSFNEIHHFGWVDSQRRPHSGLVLGYTDSEIGSTIQEARHVPLAAWMAVSWWDYPRAELLSPLKISVKYLVDTTELTPRNRRKTIAEQLPVKIISQIFRLRSCHLGLNMTFRSMLTLSLTCAFPSKPLPGVELNLTGQDQQSMIMYPESGVYRHLHDLIVPILPSYKQEGKSVLTIAMEMYRWATFSNLGLSMI